MIDGRMLTIDAIQKQSRQWDAYAAQQCQEAVRRRGTPEGDKLMAEAAELLARAGACKELADKSADIINANWPHELIRKADKLADDVRKLLECESTPNRQELKASNHIYMLERSKHEQAKR